MRCLWLVVHNNFETPKLDNRHLVVDAVLLHFIRTRTVVEVLAESCVLPVIDSVTRWWTNVKALWDAFSSWSDVVQGLVGWRHPTKKFVVVRFHPVKLTQLPWPWIAGHQHEEVRKATRNPKMHVGRLNCCPQSVSLLRSKITVTCYKHTFLCK